MGKNYVGEIGTPITYDCRTDISAATSQVLKVKKPDGTTAEWSASIYNTNYLRHVTVEGDFSLPGKYRVQSYFVLGTWTGLGETDEFEVHAAYN